MERDWTIPLQSRQVPRVTENAKIEQRLTSLTDALAAIDRCVEPVDPRAVDLAEAAGLTLANDAVMGENKLRLAGARLRRIDIALLAGSGIGHVNVRVPKFMIVPPDREHLHSACVMIAGAIKSDGGIADEETAPFEVALKMPNFDALIGIGNDAAVRALEKMGQVEFDGVAVSAGGSIAFGNMNGRPMLLLPGRFDAALAAWLAVGRRLFARLAFRLIEEQPFLLELARAVPSTRGLAEIVPVRRRAAQVEPLASGEWTPEAIARADGWILVPAESEGLAAGAKVAMRPWP
jgi:molybdopterin molybdotransferase